MSGEQLEEALVLGPENEYRLFEKRDNFDLIIYYDQSTSDASYLESGTGNRYLRDLHLALDDFSYSRPARRPPLLLSGGLDAWIDIYGPQSLLTTDSLAAASASPRPEFRSHRSSRDVNRAPTPLVLERRPAIKHVPPYPHSPGPHKSIQLDMPMPSEPINIEEEKKWLDLLHKESETVTITVPVTDSTDGKQRRRKTSIVSRSSADPYARSVEEFVSTSVDIHLYFPNKLCTRSLSNTLRLP
jgi:ubiquitin carboxyl-terminal hydrolase 8